MAKHGVDYISFDSKSDAIVKSDTSRFPSFLDEFAIVATVRDSFRGGYVFSIVKPLDSVVALGVSLYPLTHRRSSYNISLTYTNTHLYTKSQNVATFQFTYTKSSIDLSLKVTTHHISLFIGCTELKSVPRDPIHSIFDPDAKLLVGGAGLDRMMLYGDPDAAQAICRNAMVSAAGDAGSGIPSLRSAPFGRSTTRCSSSRSRSARRPSARRPSSPRATTRSQRRSQSRKPTPSSITPSRRRRDRISR